jgi:hypothetical protein
MSIKSKVLAGAATLTLVGGVGMLGALTAGTANASTPAAGPDAVELFSPLFGTHHHPTDVLDTLRQGEKVGQPQILFRTSNSDPAEDYTITDQGTVQDFWEAGLVTPALALHYGCSTTGPDDYTFESCPEGSLNDEAFEIQYSPYGVDSGLCAGVAATAWSGEDVTLQPCGVSSKTVWIADQNDYVGNEDYPYAPAINGSDTNFSQPEVLTYPMSGSPTDMPRPELYVSNLTGEQGVNNVIEPGTINDNQLWGGDYGVFPDLDSLSW